MIIENRAQYEQIPDGQICRVYLTGDEWDNNKREEKCLKIGTKLYPIKPNYFDFTEHNDDDGFDFIVCHFEKDNGN